MNAARTVFFGGAPRIPGTSLPSNVTGDCGHWHRTASAADECNRRHDKAIKKGHGRNAYSDRRVMTALVFSGRIIAGTTEIAEVA
jgi:hypothetical protein